MKNSTIKQRRVATSPAAVPGFTGPSVAILYYPLLAPRLLPRKRKARIPEFLPGDVLRRVDGNDLAAAVTNFGTEVDNPASNFAYFAATGVSSNTRPYFAASAVAATQGKAYCFEFLCILKRELRRPAAFFFDQLNRHLGGIFAFVHKLDGFSLHGLLRLVKSADHSKGSGR